MRQSQNQRLIALFDSLPLEQEVSNSDIIRLGIGPYSRRLEDIRYGHYLELGFLILNRMERDEDVIYSFYRKVRAADYPAEHSEALAAYERKAASKNRAKVPEKSDRQKNSEWFAETFHVKPKPAEPKPEPEFELTP